MSETQEHYGRVRRAAFEPKKLDDLRPEIALLIGVVTYWRFSGTGGGDEPYPGQTRWSPKDDRFGGRWSPDEDLRDVGEQPSEEQASDMLRQWHR